jgi:hypothetical protein
MTTKRGEFSSLNNGKKYNTVILGKEAIKSKATQHCWIG